jgi:L-threonylcarbamoyladenylate synthase
MPTEVLPVNAERPEPEVIARAAEVLRRGGLVAFPTETVYGLGADARNRTAVARIFTAKGRPAVNPLIVHVARWEQALQLAAAWPDTADRLAQRFWPGPLTLVLPRRDVLPETVTAGGPTVAIRVPAHPVALALLRAAVLPVAAPSANRSTNVSPTRAEHVLRGLDGRFDLLLDGGPTAGGLESTVVDVTTTPPRLLRPGLVSPGDLEAVIGPIRRPDDPQAMANPASALPSPGMLRRHYAPRALLECMPGDGGQRVEELVQQGLRVGWLTFDAAAGQERPEVIALRMPREPAAYAAQLYAALHALDDAGVERIVAALPPSGDDWLAVQDRLRRASSAS